MRSATLLRGVKGLLSLTCLYYFRMVTLDVQRGVASKANKAIKEAEGLVSIMSLNTLQSETRE